MIKIEKENIADFNEAIRGMRNPMNSWDYSDSACQGPYVLIGDNDHNLMMRLAKAGPVEGKFRRMIAVYFNNWKVCDSDTTPISHLQETCDILNYFRNVYLNGLVVPSTGKYEIEPEAKDVWWQMIQLLPSSYNQKRTVMLNYEVLANIYQHRRNHKLDEWREFCKWIKGLPYSEIIVCSSEE